MESDCRVDDGNLHPSEQPPADGREGAHAGGAAEARAREYGARRRWWRCSWRGGGGVWQRVGGGGCGCN